MTVHVLWFRHRSQLPSPQPTEEANPSLPPRKPSLPPLYLMANPPAQKIFVVLVTKVFTRRPLNNTATCLFPAQPLDIVHRTVIAKWMSYADFGSSTLSPRSRAERAVSYFGRVSLLNSTWATPAYKQQAFQQAHRLAASHTEKVVCPQVKGARPGIPSFPVL